MQNPRISAAFILQSVIEDKIFFGELKKQSSEKDLPFINMLVLTTLRHWTGLNQILDTFLSRKIANKHRIARYLLLLALAELLFMTTAPYAVINETVSNVRKETDKFLSGLANAVLRKAVQQKEILLKQTKKINPLPQNFKEILRGYTTEEIEKIAQAVDCLPTLDLTVKDEPQKWAEELSAELMPNGTLRIFQAESVHNLAGFSEGEWWVQDAAASLPVLALGNIKGKKVIDLCAAPGGKTAQLLAGGANVTALDISEKRLVRLKENMKRLKFDNLNVIHQDALEFLNNSEEKFDIVLLDAPCSATGTFRRHPEVLYIKTAEDVRQQARLQYDLLKACRNVLKPQGILLYSVCSISKAEGEEQMQRFLHENPDFALIPIEAADIEKYGKWQTPLLSADGTIRTLPFYELQKSGMDSFFICKMKRII